MVDDRKAAADVYGRQSHGKQASVTEQIRLGLEYCEAEGRPVHRVCSDKVSASPYAIKARGGWPELVADVTAGKLGLVVMWDASRGDRTLESWAGFLARCKEQGVQIYALRDRRAYDPRIPRDWRTLAEDGVDAQYESEKRSADVRRGTASAAMAGKAHGLTGFGMVRRYDSRDRKIFVDEWGEDAPIAAAIIERIARQDPLKVISDELNEAAIPAPFGGKWTRKAVRHLASNPRYIGMRRHQPTGTDEVVLYKANWPPLVSERVFWEAQAVLGNNTRKASPPGAIKYLLSYLTVGPCGTTLGARPDRPARRSNYFCVEHGCVSVVRAPLDEYITRLALARLTKPDVREALTPDDEETDLARLEVARVRAELDELAEQLELGPNNGGISAALAARAEPGIRTRLVEAEQKLAATARAGVVHALLGDKGATVDELRARWETLSVPARRSVVTAVAKEIRVEKPTRNATRWMSEDDLIRLAAERTDVTWRE